MLQADVGGTTSVPWPEPINDAFRCMAHDLPTAMDHPSLRNKAGLPVFG
jgi:hypothetical protein